MRVQDDGSVAVQIEPDVRPEDLAHALVWADDYIKSLENRSSPERRAEQALSTIGPLRSGKTRR